MSPDEIREAIEAALPGARALVRHMKGRRDHYRALVAAPHFEATSLVEQHRLVYQALGERMSTAVHALGLKTCRLEDFERNAALFEGEREEAFHE